MKLSHHHCLMFSMMFIVERLLVIRKTLEMIVFFRFISFVVESIGIPMLSLELFNTFFFV